MIRVLKIIGNILWVSLIALLLIRSIELEPPVFLGILFGAALAGIPADYSPDFKQKLAWVVLLVSVFIIGTQDLGIWTLVSFLVFAMSGVFAGLPFEAGDDRGDIFS
jgi:hypothetical protein